MYAKRPSNKYWKISEKKKNRKLATISDTELLKSQLLLYFCGASEQPHPDICELREAWNPSMYPKIQTLENS